VRLSILVLLAALYVLPLVVPVPLLDPDEGLHAAIAQEMVTRGDYVMPRFLGVPFLDKPILFFWAQAASLRAFGDHEAAVRLAGPVFGALGALTTGWIAVVVLGSRAGWLAALVYSTMLVPMALAAVPVHDIAVVPFANAALLAFWRAARAPRPRESLAWSAAAGLALGLAILTKGLTGVALVGLAHVAVLLLERRLSLVVVAGGALALAVGVIVAAPWYLAMEHVQPGYLHYYFVERHLFGFATETQRHGNRPWAYYVPVVIAGALPWMPSIAFAWNRLRPRAMTPIDAEAADASRLGWAWLLTGWIFLSAAGSKLFTYALPLFPAIALLATVAWLSRSARAGAVTRAFDRVVAVQCGIAALLLPLVVTVVPIGAKVALPAWTWGAAAVAAVAWLWTARLWLRGSSAEAARIAPLAGAIVVATVVAGVLPRVGETLTARDLAASVNRRERMPPALWVLRQRLGSVVFYLSPALRAEATPGRIEQVQLSDLRARHAPAGTLIAVAAPDQAKIQPFVAGGASFEQAGRFRLYRAEDLGVPIR
jgi:4-amino-4-deoxy-L-arabinose transferase-like glycosyltransferase